ncbi:hypothetical protein HZB05_00350 [Candidatus Wolfebacteria bacterium]|nr:hypothetical protein [Candidatus Wolfebacteria bacterium]
MKNTYPKLKFIVSFNEEYKFIKEKYDDAIEKIGKERFSFIVNHNVPNAYHKNKLILKENIGLYLLNNRKSISSNIKKSSLLIKRKWSKVEARFFNQMQDVTGIKWKNNKYNLYLLFSCFWGGDYDETQPNIYINPLLKYGDPLYVIIHELSHILYWEYINKTYSKTFIRKNKKLLWELSEVMVNYPLLNINIGIKIPLVIPPDIKQFSTKIIKKFSLSSYIDIINEVMKKARRTI